jgi:hypothetical protein
MSDKPAWDQPKEVSPEEYQQMVATGQVGKKSKAQIYLHKSSSTPTIITAVVCLSLLIGFFGGIAYEKGKVKTTSTTAASSQNSQNSFGGPGGFRRGGGAIGQVTSVSDSSITVNNQRTGSDQTFKITRSTTVSNNGADAGVSDIKSGDTVLVRVSSSDTSTATSILINPSFGGPGDMNTPDDNSGSSSTNSSGTSSDNNTSSI